MARTEVRVVYNNLPKLSAELHEKARQIVEKVAFDVEAHMKASMAEPKTGAVYGAHQASAPGEAPAIDTGNLVNSILIEMTGDLEATVSVGAEYAAPLELGTTTMAPRPFAGPAAEAVRPGFIAAMKTLVE